MSNKKVVYKRWDGKMIENYNHPDTTPRWTDCIFDADGFESHFNNWVGLINKHPEGRFVTVDVSNAIFKLSTEDEDGFIQ